MLEWSQHARVTAICKIMKLPQPLPCKGDKASMSVLCRGEYFIYVCEGYSKRFKTNSKKKL